jgi:hypothetical protein
MPCSSRGVFLFVAQFDRLEGVPQAFSDHAEGTVVAIFTDLAGENRYAVEMFGHPTIASEGSLIAHVDLVF